MAVDMTVAGPAAPPSGEHATIDRVRTGERTLLRRAAPVASLICWFYLSIVACLVVWVFVVRLLVGWTPMVVTSGSMQPSINPGDIVLSPFMGIGSEGYVALEMGRRFVGAELKASYYAQAVANLAAATVKTEDLFAA